MIEATCVEAEPEDGVRFPEFDGQTGQMRSWNGFLQKRMCPAFLPQADPQNTRLALVLKPCLAEGLFHYDSGACAAGLV